VYAKWGAAWRKSKSGGMAPMSPRRNGAVCHVTGRWKTRHINCRQKHRSCQTIDIMRSRWSIKIAKRWGASAARQNSHDCVFSCCRRGTTAAWWHPRQSRVSVARDVDAVSTRQSSTSAASPHQSVLSATGSFITSSRVRGRSIASSMSVCLFVCPLAYLKNNTSKFYHIFCMCYLWPWLGPPLTTI